MTTTIAPGKALAGTVMTSALPVGLPEVAALVDPQVSRRKLRRQLASWRENGDVYRSRGWAILDVFDDLIVDVAMFARVPETVPGPLPVVPLCVRLDYRNYDLLPPSVTFIDPITRSPAMPPLRAVRETEQGLRELLLPNHPLTGLPFLCLPGIREYHEHPQHSGDDWLLHRANGEGSLAVLCERLWLLTARTFIGLSLQLVLLNVAGGSQMTLQVLQGNIAELPAQPVAP